LRYTSKSSRKILDGDQYLIKPPKQWFGPTKEISPLIYCFAKIEPFWFGKDCYRQPISIYLFLVPLMETTFLIVDQGPTPFNSRQEAGGRQ